MPEEHVRTLAQRYPVAVRRRPSLPALERGLVQRMVRAVLKQEACSPCEVSVLLTHDAEIRNLNARWREVDAPTDVLSFGLVEAQPGSPLQLAPWPGEGLPMLGDLVVSLETASQQAAQLQVAIDEVVAHLLVHGTLHLLGHDHADPREEAAMRACEQRALACAGYRPVVWSVDSTTQRK